jgi:hypothetical protein
VRRLGHYLRQHHLALFALLLATTGTSYAAATRLLSKNSVKSPQVVNHSLQTVLSRKAIKALHGLRGAPGAAGPQGPKGPQGPQGLQGRPGADFHYAHVVVVKATGTPAANGASLVQSLGAITDNASHPYLVQLEPGTYDVGATTFELKPNVDLAGSGAAVTTITGTGHDGYTVEDHATSAKPIEIRNLSIESHAATGPANAFNVDFVGQARLVDDVLTALATAGNAAALTASGGVTVLDSGLHSTASGTGNFSQGVVNGGSVTLVGTTIHSEFSGANGMAFPVNSFSVTTLRESTASGFASGSGSGGFGLVAQQNGTITAANSVLGGSSYLTESTGSSSIKIAASQISAGASGVFLGNIPTCVVSYKGDFTPANAACG